jgi:hypothetical protein
MQQPGNLAAHSSPYYQQEQKILAENPAQEDKKPKPL